MTDPDKVMHLQALASGLVLHEAEVLEDISGRGETAEGFSTWTLQAKTTIDVTTFDSIRNHDVEMSVTKT